MSREHYKITFQPFQRTVSALAGTGLLEAATKAGISINIPCAGQGTCGKCKIKVISGHTTPTDSDVRIFDKNELKNGYRLACQLKIEDNLVIDIPQESLLAGKYQILTETYHVEHEVVPCVQKQYLELEQPSLENDKSDLDRIQQSLRQVRFDLDIIRKTPTVLRENGFKGTAVVIEDEFIDFEAGDTTEQCFGAAFDIGTTTVVGKLLDLTTGKELAITSRLNPQVSFGDDVLSRINFCTQEAENTNQLSEVIRTCIGEMINELAQKAKVDNTNIYEVCVAGNTTMEHIFCGINPASLGQLPFVPTFSHGLIVSARALELPINRRGRVCVFPIIGGFVGGDTTACILAARLWEEEAPALLVDIGTNGEIVLVNEGKMLASSAAAGPALEGARISCGMRAAVGAIDKIVFNSDLELSVIGETQPRGICGSALIDIVAGLLRLGIIDTTGQLLPPEQIDPSVPQTLRERIHEDEDGQKQFFIAEGVNKTSLYLTQKDIREMQLAVGAIRAGINIMLKKANLTIDQLGKIYLAGGFGCYIDSENAKQTGLLPHTCETNKIACVGNASLAGTKWALLSTDARVMAESIARKVEHVELSLDMNFQMEFADSMIFPD